MQAIMASTSYLQSISASGSIQSLERSYETLMAQKNSLENSNLSEEIKIEKAELLEQRMQKLKEQMEAIKEARAKIEDNKADEKKDKRNTEAETNNQATYNSNGDEVREDIIIAASLNEEIKSRSNTHKE